MSGTFGIKGSINTSLAFRQIGKIFESSTGIYSFRLKEKVNLVSKFINEFNTNFSSTINYGLGGCSISTMDGKIIFFYKIKSNSFI